MDARPTAGEAGVQRGRLAAGLGSQGGAGVSPAGRGKEAEMLPGPAGCGS